MEKRKKIIIVLMIIGVVLIFSTIRSAYLAYKRDKSYEARGYETASAICIDERSRYNYNGTRKTKKYQREYLYFVSGEKYTLNITEVDSYPHKKIKYNPSNPYEAETYDGINTETIVCFFVGLTCIFSPFILKVINNQKTDN